MVTALGIDEMQTSRAIYARPFLMGHLLQAAETPDDNDFARFQREMAQEFHADFTPDTLSVAIMKYGEEGVFERVEFCCADNQPEGTLSLYREHQHRDVMTGANLLVPGAALFNTVFKTWDEWMNDEFYTLFKAPLGLHHTVVVHFRYPLKKRFSIRFGYQTIGKRNFGPGLTKDDVEFFSIPFMVAWLYRLNTIDRETMIGWLELLEGMTPLRLAVLRDLTNTTRYRTQSLADKLGLTARALSDQLAEIYGNVSHLLGSLSGETHPAQLVDLSNAFGFLQFAGLYQPEHLLRDQLRIAGYPITSS